MLKIFKNFFKSLGLKAPSVNEEHGFNNDAIYDPTNNFNFCAAPSEKIVQGPSNSCIVLGRDRPGSLKSGYGAKGHFKCGSIDIVAGRLSSVDATTINGRIDPSTGADASRVYLSQKADIDDYYSLAAGRSGKSIARAAIAIKSDDIRVIARNSLKLVTNTDSFLSTSGRALTKHGVELIANNDDSDMQPIPKGTNLEYALTEILEKLLELNGIVTGIKEVQNDFNTALASHVHVSAWPGEYTLFSVEAADASSQATQQYLTRIGQGLTNHSNNIAAMKSKYLTAGTSFYINSAHHYLN